MCVCPPLPFYHSGVPVEDLLETKNKRQQQEKHLFAILKRRYGKTVDYRGPTPGKHNCVDDSSPMHFPQRKKSCEEKDDFRLAKGMQKSLHSLPFHFNLDEFEQNINDGYSHDNESPTHNNYEVTQIMKKHKT